MSRSVVARFGVMGHVGRFRAPDDLGLGRGDLALLRTHRGREFGEILAVTQEADAGPPLLEVLGLASTEELEGRDSRRVAAKSIAARALDVFVDGEWPIELVDVEMTADGEVILLYLGSHRLDFEGLRALLRSRLGAHVTFEPVGRDFESESRSERAEASACESCGSTTGGCGEDDHESAGNACGSCALPKLLASARPRRTKLQGREEFARVPQAEKSPTVPGGA